DFEEAADAPEGFGGRHLRVAVGPRGKGNGDFGDIDAIDEQNMEALEKKGICHGAHETENAGRKAIEPVGAEGSGAVIGKAEQCAGEKMGKVRQKLSFPIPSIETTRTHVTGADDGIGVFRFL